MTDQYFPIETERLVLRRFTMGDVDAVHAYSAREDVARFMIWEPLDRDMVTARIKRWLDHEGPGVIDGSLSYAVTLKSDGSLIGDCGLMFRNPEARQGEIGYVLHPDFHGAGLGTEAATQMLRVGFDLCNLHRIYARCDARNEASWRLMERLGMRREAHFREHALFKGGWDDEFYYAILEDEWRAKRGH